MKDAQDQTVGKFLQQERERKGVSLEAVSKATRISWKSLEALEGDDFAALPAPIFIRSFLKTYASFLGLNPDKVIAQYETQTGIIGISSIKGTQPEKGFPRIFFLMIISFLVVLVGVGIYWFSSSGKIFKAHSPAPVSSSPGPSPVTEKNPPSSPDSPSPQEKMNAPEKAQPLPKEEVRPSPPAPPVSQPSSTPPAASSEIAPGAPLEEKKERRHILRMQAREQTWVRVQTDDQPEFEVLLEPKEKAVWTARREMKITLGNAGGVDMVFNGKKVPAFGESGQVVRFQFPRDAAKKGE